VLFWLLTLALFIAIEKENSVFLIKTRGFKILEFNRLKIYRFLFEKKACKIKDLLYFCTRNNAGFGSSVG
jgi:hypothetical protein